MILPFVDLNGLVKRQEFCLKYVAVNFMKSLPRFANAKLLNRAVKVDGPR